MDGSLLRQLASDRVQSGGGHGGARDEVAVNRARDTVAGQSHYDFRGELRCARQSDGTGGSFGGHGFLLPS